MSNCYMAGYHDNRFYFNYGNTYVITFVMRALFLKKSRGVVLMIFASHPLLLLENPKAKEL